MTAAIDHIASRLRAAGCVFAEEEAALLVEAGARGLDQQVARRVAGEPLEHVLGWARFDGLRIVVEPGVFVPRRRSELLVHEVCRLVRPGSVVVDLCCGSGAIGAAVAARVPGAEVYAADVDPRAVACAARNLSPDRVLAGNLYAALPAGLRGRVDVIVVNAPYVPSDEIAFMPREARLYEPRTALDGGADGLDWHRLVAAGAPDWLTLEGALLIETSRRQAERTCEILAAAGCGRTRVRRSQELDATVAVARRRLRGHEATASGGQVATHPLWRPYSSRANADRQRQRVAYRQTQPGPLQEHREQWAVEYRELRRLILAAIPNQVLSINHVGSTAIPGLIAKPVIDIDVTVPDVEDEVGYLPGLEAAGFRLIFRDDLGGDPHRQLTFADPNANLHVWNPGAVEPSATRSSSVGCGPTQETPSGTRTRSSLGPGQTGHVGTTI